VWVDIGLADGDDGDAPRTERRIQAAVGVVPHDGERARWRLGGRFARAPAHDDDLAVGLGGDRIRPGRGPEPRAHHARAADAPPEEYVSLPAGHLTDLSSKNAAKPANQEGMGSVAFPLTQPDRQPTEVDPSQRIPNPGPSPIPALTGSP